MHIRLYALPLIYVSFDRI